MSDFTAQDLRAHPAAEVFPMMPLAELKELAADMKRNGQRKKIVLHPEGLILDGRNRYEACKLEGLTPMLEKWDGELGTEFEFVLSMNLHRRHLSESQRAMVGARVKPHLEPALRSGAQADDENPDLGSSEKRSRSAAAAEKLNVSKSSIDSATRVIRDGVPQLVEAVDKGEASVDAAAVIAKLPVEEQTQLVARGPEEIQRMAKELRTKTTRDAMVSSESEEHYTPPDIVDRFRALFGGVIDLDPASSKAANTIVRAAIWYGKVRDGLLPPWRGRTLLNPPYGKNESGQSLAGLWTAKMIAEYEAGRVTAGGLIINGYPDRKWFHPLWNYPICFPWDRLEFLDENLKPQTQPMHPSALVYLGHDVDRFVELFSPIGKVVLPGQKYSTSVVTEAPVLISSGDEKLRLAVSVLEAIRDARQIAPARELAIDALEKLTAGFEVTS